MKQRGAVYYQYVDTMIVEDTKNSSSVIRFALGTKSSRKGDA
jgi:hypothetical protein